MNTTKLTPLKKFFPQNTPSKFAKLLKIPKKTFYGYWYGDRRPSPERALAIKKLLEEQFNIKISLEEIQSLKYTANCRNYQEEIKNK